MHLDMKALKSKFPEEVYTQMKQRKKLVLGVVREISQLDRHYNRPGMGDHDGDDLTDARRGGRKKRGAGNFQKDLLD